jgi:RHS repeat-associated protein
MGFDANGNLTSLQDGPGLQAFTWDARDRLRGLSGPSTSASFAYDALGRRAQRTVNSLLTQFHYDGLDIVRESGGAGDASYLRTLAIDEALARNQDTFFLGEALGSTAALTDPTGAPVTEYSYSPFGTTSATGAPSPNPFQYTGRENDGAGLYYYRARYYEPGRGRLVQEDPIRLLDESNIYTYADNRPVANVDPLGLYSWNEFMEDCGK